MLKQMMMPTLMEKLNLTGRERLMKKKTLI